MAFYAGGTDYFGNRENYEAQQSAQRTQQALDVSTRKMARTASDTANWQLQQAQEAWDLKKSQAEKNSEMASQFLSLWTGSMGESQKMFKSAIDSLMGLSSGIAGNNQATQQIYQIADTIGKEYQSYREQVGGTEGELLAGSKEEGLARRGAIQTMQGLMKPDYEAAEGRISADVRTQAENQREAEANRMMSMGIDPSSGRFGALTKKSYLDQAGQTAIAMNVARRGEKERVAGVAEKGLQLYDPSKTAGTAINMRKAGTDILGMQAGALGKAADIQTAQTNATANIAQATGQLANAYNQSVTQPYGEMAGYFMGQGAISL